jgi:hypothetical protein
MGKNPSFIDNLALNEYYWDIRAVQLGDAELQGI